MGSYAVRAPLGEEWRVQIDNTTGMVAFKKDGPDARFILISILPGFVKPGTENQSEDTIATMVLAGEVSNMIQRGAAKSYTPKDVSTEVTTIGGKKLYAMSYTIVDRSLAEPLEVQYKMYLYLPPDLKATRVFYGFLIGELHKQGELVYETDLTRIYAVISSFYTKSW